MGKTNGDGDDCSATSATGRTAAAAAAPRRHGHARRDAADDGEFVTTSPAISSPPRRMTRRERSDASASPADRPVESPFYFRKSGRWRRGYGVLDGGSIACHRPAYARKRREAEGHLMFRIPADVSWTARDIQSSATSFVVEIQGGAPRASVRGKSAFGFGFKTNTRGTTLLGDCDSDSDCDGDSDELNSIVDDHDHDHDGDGEKHHPCKDRRTLLNPQTNLSESFRHSLRRANEVGKPFRIYIKCSRTRNDKARWIAAFSRLGRLSQELKAKRSLSRMLHAPSLMLSRSRIRNPAAMLLHGIDDPRFHMAAERFKNLQLKGKDPSSSQSSRPRGWGSEREYRVYPAYAYPRRWMTNEELHAEMNKPSEKFHDLRVPSAKSQEIGSLRVEVLRCIGLPKQNSGSGTDAVVYLVCGSHAFTTDTIWNRMSPMWLSKTRRACVFPLFRAYARLYAGVFDDDGKNEKDDFAGRIVVDLARCRAGSVYDVTLPLRTSAHVYTRRARGAIRLRFSLRWNSERDALLSYIPKKLRFPSKKRPDEDVTVMCGDEKAFRNVALTVHGLHMPGRFSSQQFKATLKEINFNRKLMIVQFRMFCRNTRRWEEPSVSGYIFVAWMHCVYRNAFHLVPAYVVLFLFLMLMRSYFVFGAPGALHNGFAPPSWTEMLRALLFAGDAIEPLEIQPSRSTNRARMLTANEIALEPNPAASSREILPATERPEFPFSRGLNYPKLTVKEAVVVTKNPKKKRRYLLRKSFEHKEDRDDDDDDEDEFLGPAAKPENPFDLNHLSKTIKIGLTGKSDDEEDDDQNGKDNGLSISLLNFTRFLQNDSSPRVIVPPPKHVHDDDESSALSHASGISSIESKIDDGESDDGGGEDDDRKKAPIAVPEQDIDVVPEKRSKKLDDDLRDMRETFHRFTGFLFDDRTHIIKNAKALYFGEKIHSKKRRRKKTDVSQEIDRLLKVGTYSSSNPIVSRLGVYVEPMISSALSFLCLNRALYNLVTWMDPFLTFLVSVVLLVSSLVLFIFPWRIFLFVLGFIVVGPQNWIFRKLKERRKGTKREKGDGVDSDEDPSTDDDDDDDDDLPLDQPIINSRTGTNNSTPQQLKREDVDTRGIHRVCVPYSQLRYQRFYDWPPEREYSTVERG